ncbi:MAG: 6-pyruvoyl-tetrahydropterin synthase-related protein [Georgfuchsia sp.]
MITRTHLRDGLIDALFILATGALVANTLGIEFLNSPNWPTGGDSASHLLYAWLYADSLLFSGKVLPWVPEVFGGLPFLSYYFPLPFIVIALLSKLIGIAQAYKWGAFLAAMLLPGAVFVASRRWLRMSWAGALFGGLGALAFLLHEQNSIWGGNLLSTLAGEFGYSYGICLAVLAMIAWSRAVHTGRGWVIAALLEAATGFCHGFPLLVVGFSTVFLLFEGRQFLRTLGLLARGHLLAFCLLGGWLWPMLEMHGLTIPNDAAFPLQGWRDLLPATLWPVAAAGLAGLCLQLVPAVRRSWSAQQASTLRYFVGGAGLAALGFIAGDQLGLADIRFFPLVWLLAAIVCGWLFGQTLTVIGEAWQPKRKITLFMFAAAAALGLMGWLGQQVRQAPDWALWNHAGLDAKPQWHNLSSLFPAMSGDLWSPRLVFEHDPDNNDIGSTRSLEALPMFLNHRPVLEGLYMETALLGPAIYQLQSEISARPSSPLVRFPSGSLDPEFAARHMNLLHADTLLLRSQQAKSAIESSGLFDKVADAPPFALYKLHDFNSHLIELVRRPMRVRPRQDWMQDAFAWFRTRSRFDAYLPVYGDLALDQLIAPGPADNVRVKSLSRHEMVFETNAIGSPHLIKIAYHPRWQLQSKGQMTVAGPGYMLVIPQEKEIRLVYGHTLVGKLGMVATVLAALFALFALWVQRRQALLEKAEERALKPWWPVLVAWLLLLATGTYFGTRSPERVYSTAWKAMAENRYAEASEGFARAYQLRRPPAKKEEALFWLAKASELAGQREQAKARYLELAEHYHGYWLPESLYTYVLMERQDGHADRAAPFATRLHEEYPGNKWTLEMDKEK